ncbi:MAG TPA: TonB-dependent receptor, partial [Myxococcaceae bacterium]|nr:TonB-dependent receptor [Myxococcaceae bacterium]
MFRSVPRLGVLCTLLLGALASAEEASVPTGAPLSFESAELRELAGTWGEPFRAVMLLPGVSHVVSGVGLPVVRGAAPSSTAVYLDGVRVPQLYHLGLGPSIIHPELIGGLDFHRGPAPARFGRELGGTVEAHLVPPSADTVRAEASLELLTAGVLTRIPMTATGTELTLAGRFAWTPWLFAAYSNGTRTGPEWVLDVFDYQARVTQRVGRGSLRLLAFGGSDDAGLSGEGDVAAVGAGFHRVDLRLTHPLGAGEAEAALTVGQDRLGFDAGGDASRLAVGLKERMLGARVSWRVPLAVGLALEVGADMEHRLSELAQSTTFRPGEAGEPSRPTVTSAVLQPLARATFAGAYAQATWRHGGWSLTPGLRVDGYSLGAERTEVVLEPRLHARGRLSETVVVRLGAGLRHQPPAHLVDVPGLDAAALRLGMQRAVQLDAGADVRGPADFTFSADVFAQPHLRTVELDVLNFGGRARTAEGHGYGVELMARRALTESWSLLAAYSFQWRRLHELERRHVLNAAATVKLPWGLTVGTTLH